MSILELGKTERVAAPIGAGPNPAFWSGRRVLVTGHTGFKGAWLSLWLQQMGADVWGLALPPDGDDCSLFDLAKVGEGMTNRLVNLRNREGVAQAVADARPQIVLHLAAQAIVARAPWEPTETWETNVLGTQHVLDALRGAPGLAAVLVATSDSVYAPNGSGRPMRETHPLGGDDPYSASKAACEILTAASARTYFEPSGVRVATARAGAIIGGGDLTPNRFAPDCVRAALQGAPVTTRGPDAPRSWTHVLDCLNAYLLHAERLALDAKTPRALNIGAAPANQMSETQVADVIAAAFDAPQSAQLQPDAEAPTTRAFTTDTRLARQTLGWDERLPGVAGVYATAFWYRACASGSDMRATTLTQLHRFVHAGADLNRLDYRPDAEAAA